MMAKTCRFVIGHPTAFTEKRCGKKATFVLDEGGHKGSGLCTKHAIDQKRKGYRVRKIK